MPVRLAIFILSLALVNLAYAQLDQRQIVAENTPAIVYLEVRDSNGAVLNRGTGFVVSNDGYVVTVAHLKVDHDQKMWAVIGQREGTRYTLALREKARKMTWPSGSYHSSATAARVLP